MGGGFLSYQFQKWSYQQEILETEEGRGNFWIEPSILSVSFFGIGEGGGSLFVGPPRPRFPTSSSAGTVFQSCSSSDIFVHLSPRVFNTYCMFDTY